MSIHSFSRLQLSKNWATYTNSCSASAPVRNRRTESPLLASRSPAQTSCIVEPTAASITHGRLRDGIRSGGHEWTVPDPFLHADPFKSIQLRKRIRMIVNPDVQRGPFIVSENEQHSRLFSAAIAG